MSTRDVAADLDLALECAALGERVAASFFGRENLHVTSKPDGSPVTIADSTVEEQMRALLMERRPGDGILGEELGEWGQRRTRWIIDPIDGTHNFINVDPAWAVLIGLQVDGEVTVGVVNAPMLGRRWWAGRGLGAFADGHRMRASATEALARSHYTQRTARRLRAHSLSTHLTERLEQTMGPGGPEFFWADLLVADGTVDIDVSLNPKIWDLAARRVILEESGAKSTDIHGEHRIDTGSSLTANPRLHAALLEPAESAFR